MSTKSCGGVGLSHPTVVPENYDPETGTVGPRASDAEPPDGAADDE